MTNIQHPISNIRSAATAAGYRLLAINYFGQSKGDER